jgi:hypothetical protein
MAKLVFIGFLDIDLYFGFMNQRKPLQSRNNEYYEVRKILALIT